MQSSRWPKLPPHHKLIAWSYSHELNSNGRPTTYSSELRIQDKHNDNMASRSAITLVQKSKASSPEILQLRCHIRPGASKIREGVAAVTDESIELCVAAPPQDGKANKAVIGILSEVSDIDPLYEDFSTVVLYIEPALDNNRHIDLGSRKIRPADYTWDEDQGQDDQYCQRLLPARKGHGSQRGPGSLG